MGGALFSQTTGVCAHGKGQNNPTSAVFGIKPGDPLLFQLWYILTDQVNKLKQNSGTNVPCHKAQLFGDKEMVPNL